MPKGRRGRPPLGADAMLAPRTVRFSRAMLDEIARIKESEPLKSPDFGDVVRRLCAEAIAARKRKDRS